MIDIRSRAFIAVVAAAVGSSLLCLAILIVANQFAASGSSAWAAKPGDIVVVAAVALIWAPAFALIPVALLGYFVERPKARWMIADNRGIIVHLSLSVMAAILPQFLAYHKHRRPRDKSGAHDDAQ